MMRNLLILLLIVVLATLCPCKSRAQSPTLEPFDVYIEYVEDITYYHRAMPQVDFVYGNPNTPAPGFLVVVTPHPERALVAQMSVRTVDPRDFRVWIEAGQPGEGNWKPLGLFVTNLQTLQYLEVRRKNTNAFALFISKDNIVTQVPQTDLHNISAIMRFKLRFNFASDANANWPVGKACALAHPCKVMNYTLTFYPGENFLNNKIERVDEADKYMHQHPERKYFYRDEEVWQCSGWFFHLSYKDKVYLRQKVNDKHYVIFTLWKDEAHTQPLLLSYFKDNLYPGGACDDKSLMEERFNYIAYPHQGFDDWSLFIPWECVDYWWKDGIKPTKDNHTCTAYYTLTLSNDGVTPATRNDYDDSGWLSVGLQWEEPKPANTQEPDGEKSSGGGKVGDGEKVGGDDSTKTCKHPQFKLGQERRGVGSDLLPNGCTRDYDLYWRWKECLICGAHFDQQQDCKVYTDTRCTRHNMKEVSRRQVGKLSVRKVNSIVTKTTFEVVSQCQNDCCSYKDSHQEYQTDIAPILPVDTTKTCPPHKWEYFSDSLITPDIIRHFSVEVPSYDKSTLTVKAEDIEHNMFRHTFNGEEPHCYISQQPIDRQLWLAMNSDNNYLAFSAKDPGALNGVTYQEVYDLIDTLNIVVRDIQKLNVLLSLPSADEMKQLIAQQKVKFDTDPIQPLQAFYIDSIEVYDGKNRPVSDEKLATAPEGARVRVMVGRMNRSGAVEMVDVSTADATTGVVLKATPFSTVKHLTHQEPGRFYVKYFRRCLRCKLQEIICESKFRNARYHRSVVN